MASEWLIVLNADGTVLAVDGGVPLGWIGTRLEDQADAAAELRRAAAEVRSQSHDAAGSADLFWKTLLSGRQPVRILGLHAVPVRRVPTDLRALLASTVSVMALQARALDVALTLDVGSDVPATLSLDPEKLAWTITALVGNALRFVRHGTRTMPGGRIEICARYEPAASRVTLEVQDDGRGIPKDKLPELLRRSPRQLHASGLTLSLVQDVVAAHGGAFQLQSSTEADSPGTTVRLTLPCP